jgi:hypothetical protein
MEASAENYLGSQSWKPVFNAYAMIIHVNSNNVLFDTIKWLTILYSHYPACVVVLRRLLIRWGGSMNDCAED